MIRVGSFLEVQQNHFTINDANFACDPPHSLCPSENLILKSVLQYPERALDLVARHAGFLPIWTT